MKILFIGDVVGKSGRDALADHLPVIRKTLNPDSIIVNGENTAHGIGITPKIADEIFDLGVSCITGGNHSFDKKEIIPYMPDEPRLIRPVNFPTGTPGNGVHSYRDSKGHFVTVINVMARLFMGQLIDCPFRAMDLILENVKLKSGADAIIVDFHGEATSEKLCMGQHLNGRVSAVLGTHTHIPTADYQVLSKGTAYQTDVGMTGDYDSIIGVAMPTPLNHFMQAVRYDKFEPADNQGTLCGSLIEIDDATGLAKSIKPVRYAAGQSQLEETV